MLHDRVLKRQEMGSLNNLGLFPQNFANCPSDEPSRYEAKRMIAVLSKFSKDLDLFWTYSLKINRNDGSNRYSILICCSGTHVADS